MSKLLSANFIRLKKDKFFWSGLVFMLAAGIFFPVMRYMDMRQTQTINRIDNGFFGCALFIGIVMAVFCSLFIGTEYSEGTIRNKIIIGQKRGTVYLSNFITCSLVSVVMCMAFFIPYLCIGIPLLGFFEMDIKIVLLFAVTVLMTAIVFSSIFTLISMLNNNKAVTAVICILTAFLFLIIGAQLHKMLSEPETNMALVMTDNGQEYQELPNPKFLDGGGRKTVQFFYDFLPGGQVVQCTSLETENLSLLPVYSLVIVVLTTSAGMFFFKKERIKVGALYMEFWLLVVIGILLIIIFSLVIKLFFVHKTVREIEAQFTERLMTETNTLIDISHRNKIMCGFAKRLNTELRKLRKERHRFQQGDLELKNAVTNISHDLRTPLTAISGYLDLLDNAEKSEEAERYIKVIRNRTEVLRQLTEELFCYSVVTSPEYDNDVEFVSVNSVLEESILGFYAVLQERNITPNISMPENKVFRKVNRAALSRIFSNLLNNAIKYSDGDLNITLNDTGEITFSNTASDLSEVDVKKLFDRFYTVENARKSTGLGLSISRILIEQMKGTISAQYKNGKLSICIWLPDVSGD